MSHHNGEPVCVSPAINIGNVCALLKVKNKANNNSFQENMKQNTATVAKEGAASGRTTLRRTPNTEQPSIIADSSTSLGNSRKNSLIIQTTKGRFIAVWTSITACKVSSIFSVLKMTKKGKTIATGGKNLFDRIQKAISSFFQRLNLNLAKLYAAKEPIVIARAVLDTPIIRLFVTVLKINEPLCPPVPI